MLSRLVSFNEYWRQLEFEIHRAADQEKMLMVFFISFRLQDLIAKIALHSLSCP